jgi:hypothetical protein
VNKPSEKGDPFANLPRSNLARRFREIAIEAEISAEPAVTVREKIERARVSLQEAVTKTGKPGRPSLGPLAMTSAERQRLYRERKKKPAE